MSFPQQQPVQSPLDMGRVQNFVEGYQKDLKAQHDVALRGALLFAAGYIGWNAYKKHRAK